MKNPYDVLGISESATNEEVRDAYRALAKKYHPDNYIDSPLAEMAEERMKEINEAYDEILRRRTSGSGNGTGGSSYSNSYTSGDFSSNYDPTYSQIRASINKGDYKNAESMLNNIPQTQRGAEWFFLKGCILVHRGYHFDAMRYVDRACELDPNNREYSTLRDNLRVQSQQYSNPAQHQQAGGCNMCDVCSFLICLDCLCR